MANTKTSISFGNERVAYISDTMENQRKVLSLEASSDERLAQKERIAKMKADLTTTNFSLGNEATVYATVNSEAMAKSEQFKGVGRVAMNNDIKEAVKKSSLHFGNENVEYKSVAHEAMEYRGNENNFAKLKEEVQQMTATLRKHNFSFGEEEVLYQTDYNRGYGDIKLEAYNRGDEQKVKQKALILDSRSCHFSLGQDKIKYESNTQAALETIRGHAPADVAKAVERAKQMKSALQKTSIVIGDNEAYM